MIKLEKISSKQIKAKDKLRLSTLRMLLSTIDNERSKKSYATTDEEVYEEVYVLIKRNIKQLKQEIESLVKADRQSFDQQMAVEILESYLPKQLSEEELRKEIELVIKETKNFGMAMKTISSKFKFNADMKVVNKIVKEVLK